MNFRDTFARMDKTLAAALGDTAALDVLGTGLTETSIPGFFDAPWLEPTIGRLRTEIVEPSFTVEQSVNLAGVVKGQSLLTFDEHEYEIIDIKPDGTGRTTLILRPAA